MDGEEYDGGDDDDGGGDEVVMTLGLPFSGMTFISVHRGTFQNKKNLNIKNVCTISHILN